MNSPRGRKPAAASKNHLSTIEAKKLVLERVRQGATNAEAERYVGRNGGKFIEYHRKNDSSFRDELDQIRALQRVKRDEKAAARDISFSDWCEKYLGTKVFWHQHQWVDLLEGREPRDLHPSQQYVKGDKTRLIVNTPPFHAKSMTLTINWVTYRICMDPSVRVLIISKTQTMAKKFLYGIKQRLSHPKYKQLQVDYAPEGGWQDGSSSWRAEMIYVGKGDAEGGEKDPTVEAVGIGGHIYGSRADIIIMDDGVAMDNAHQWEQQKEWLDQEVDSRIEEGTGILLVIGTRVEAQDLYSELRNPDNYLDAEGDEDEDQDAVWTYLSQPAVLETADKPKDWKTVWPRSNLPWKGSEDKADADGLYPRWDGTRLAKKRRKLGPKKWSLVYMQEDVPEDSVFTAYAVKRSINGLRSAGPFRAGAPGHPEHGLDGMYVIGSLDPAGAAGHLGAVVYAVHRESGKRYVLQCNDKAQPTPAFIKGLFYSWTDEYGINEWVVEKNAFQTFLSQDEEINAYLQGKGVRLREHFTGNNKLDPDFGVMSLAPLFGVYGQKNQVINEPIIELPTTYKSEGTQALVDQLVIWQRDAPKRQKTDMVMALWFAELRAREVLGLRRRSKSNHVPNQYLSAHGRSQQKVVPIRDWYVASA